MTATPQSSARRYRIERYLTEGGMGAIYVGKKLGPGGFEKEVVLKQLLPEYTARPEFRDLFFREAKISATLDHANIVHTFDLVESEESLFIVMEYVRGVDLRTIIRRAKLRRRDVSPAAALHIALEVLAGLAYAHNRRAPNGASMEIIHRDVSPSNILCSAQGEVKLSDFGIAKAATHASAFYRVRGKVGYMSPEQARNEPIDHRTDLFSVAVCLYEALTAERLFVGDLSTPADVIYGQPIVPPSRKRKGLPPALDVVLATALARDPDDRYQDTTAFSDALRQVAHRHGMLFSAPQLGEHLRYILGSDPNNWLDDKPSPSGDPATQRLPAKQLEGKEAKSIGVVEGSGLYVVSGNDAVSQPAAPRSTQRLDSRAPPRRAPASPAMDALPPIAEDGTTDEDEIPTRTRNTKVEATPAPPLRIPPPAANSPAPPGLSAGGPPLRSRPTRRAMPPPPPPLPPSPAPAPGPALPDSPFDLPPTPAPILADDFPTTPPPVTSLPSYDAQAITPPPPAVAREPPAELPSLPQPAQHPAAGAVDPATPKPAAESRPPFDQAAPAQPAASFNFAAFPITDFGAPAEPVARRAGPPGLLLLLVMLVAAAGGAKLGEIVTRADLVALDRDAASIPAPASAAPPPAR
jgi:eukaryotic-like serine/threonine-protein kinase